MTDPNKKIANILDSGLVLGAGETHPASPERGQAARPLGRVVMAESSPASGGGESPFPRQQGVNPVIEAAPAHTVAAPPSAEMVGGGMTFTGTTDRSEQPRRALSPNPGDVTSDGVLQFGKPTVPRAVEPAAAPQPDHRHLYGGQ